ncbi:MAG: 2-C-methyl-D-erythritol 4-phosphate cytidylyltransferase [Thiomargarita sp.]|nr:2-C-methyl-D-erythritol 4-phosphate cytidylyltransferase [Thiomargarita sp.]
MSNNINYWVIIPAAGIGTRMQNKLPKQYLLLQNKPILQHTIERLALAKITGIVVCLAKNDPHWEKLTLPRTIIPVEGGAERCHSVLNGLNALRNKAQPDDWILVHDAARPCVRIADIEKLMLNLAEHPIGGLLATPVRDTMKRANNTAENPEVLETVDRQNLWHALTPQMFRWKVLHRALQNVLEQGELVTDEAQAIEKLNLSPVLIEGHADNIKITHPQDLKLAELYLQQQAFY